MKANQREPEPSDGDAPSMAISESAAHSISAVVTGGGIRPVDFAVEELRRAQDRDAWLRAAFRATLAERAPEPGELVRGCVGREALDAMRRQATLAFGSAARVESRNAALVVYALAVAAGLVQHRALLSSQPRGEIDLMLAELAGVLGEPFAGFLESAVRVGGAAA